MALHTTLVTLFNYKRQRIPRHTIASLSKEETGRRFVTGLIEGICHRTSLEIDGIEPCGLQDIEILGHLCLLSTSDSKGGTLLSRPVNIIHCGEPDSAHLTLDIRICSRCRQHKRSKRNKK